MDKKFPNKKVPYFFLTWVLTSRRGQNENPLQRTKSQKVKLLKLLGSLAEEGSNLFNQLTDPFYEATASLFAFTSGWIGPEI